MIYICTMIDIKIVMRRHCLTFYLSIFTNYAPSSFSYNGKPSNLRTTIKCAFYCSVIINGEQLGNMLL